MAGLVLLRGSLNHWPLQLGMDLEESRTIRPDEYFNLEAFGTFSQFGMCWIQFSVMVNVTCLHLEVGSDKDYLASSIAYHLDLHGTAEAGFLPKSCAISHRLKVASQVVQTACSSALVAISRAAKNSVEKNIVRSP